jgi:undecaprenyl-diphosphatase
MNEYLEAIILGIVQGLTEFLPVSSSGHLELAKTLLGDGNTAAESFLMTVVLHFGTALATVWVFRKYIVQLLGHILKPEGRKFIWLIILSMIPAILVGVGLESQITALFDKKIIFVAAMLCVTGIVLILSDQVGKHNRPISPWFAMLIGVAQAIAILPGISRSGSTIAAAVGLGIDRKEAAQFSFLMVIPLIFGKILKDALDSDVVIADTSVLPLCIGFIFSFFVGIFACQWMVNIVKKARLRYFGFYCIAIGILVIIFRLWIIQS